VITKILNCGRMPTFPRPRTAACSPCWLDAGERPAAASGYTRPIRVRTRQPGGSVHGLGRSPRRPVIGLLLDVHPRLAMQILRHTQIAMMVEVYSEAPTAKTNSQDQKCAQAAGQAPRWSGCCTETRKMAGSTFEISQLNWVELRGFEPLTPSVRTLDAEVARGRWGKSATDGSRREPFAVGGVADYMGAGCGRTPFPAQPGSATLRASDELGKEARDVCLRRYRRAPQALPGGGGRRRRAGAAEPQCRQRLPVDLLEP
jgi:hypothetical protein